MNAPRPLTSLLVLALALTGCARALAPPRAPVAEEARQAVALLVERWHEFADLRTLADLRVERGGQRQRLQGVLLARAPASVRFEALSPFGPPLLAVVIHDGELTAYNAAANEAVVGPATADTAARLFGLPLEPMHLVGVLAGRAVPPTDLRLAHILPADEHGPSLELVGTDHRQRVWMDFTTGVVDRLEIAGGRYEVRIAYQRDEQARVRGFEFAAAGGYVTGTVRYRDPVVDGGVDPERFRLQVPDTAKIKRLR